MLRKSLLWLIGTALFSSVAWAVVRSISPTTLSQLGVTSLLINPSQASAAWSGSGASGLNNVLQFNFGAYTGACTAYCFANFDYLNQWNVAASGQGNIG